MIGLTVDGPVVRAEAIAQGTEIVETGAHAPTYVIEADAPPVQGAGRRAHLDQQEFVMGAAAGKGGGAMAEQHAHLSEADDLRIKCRRAFELAHVQDYMTEFGHLCTPTGAHMNYSSECTGRRLAPPAASCSHPRARACAVRLGLADGRQATHRHQAHRGARGRAGLRLSRVAERPLQGPRQGRHEQGGGLAYRPQGETTAPAARHGERRGGGDVGIVLRRRPARAAAAAAQLIDDRRRYSVWCKPARVMAQGTDYGDHCSLLRQAELHFKPARAAYPVHRLDRVASGLMLVAHDAEAAARLSALFRDNQIEKLYGVRVRGAAPQERGTIDLPLDDKPALTHYIVRDYDGTHDISTLEVRIESGRLHQIRRHLALIDLPVLGDPRYGTGNKNTEGLQLQAISLEFICPYSGEKRSYQLR